MSEAIRLMGIELENIKIPKYILNRYKVTRSTTLSVVRKTEPYLGKVLLYQAS